MINPKLTLEVAMQQVERCRGYADPIENEQVIIVLGEAIEKLRSALMISRGQWIHSINAAQCLKALGESVPDYVRNRILLDASTPEYEKMP